jgi:hypothetical protein
LLLSHEDILLSTEVSCFRGASRPAPAMRVRVAVGRSLLAASAQLVREPPLPMLARPPVLDAVEDEKRPPVHAAASIRPKAVFHSSWWDLA